MQQYDHVVEDGAERIVRRWEREGQQRHRVENVLVWTEAFQRVGGTVFGFVVALAAVGVGAWLVVHGHDGPGVATIMAGLGSVGVAHGVGIYKRKP